MTLVESARFRTALWILWINAPFPVDRGPARGAGPVEQAAAVPSVRGRHAVRRAPTQAPADQSIAWPGAVSSAATVVDRAELTQHGRHPGLAQRPGAACPRGWASAIGTSAASPGMEQLGQRAARPPTRSRGPRSSGDWSARRRRAQPQVEVGAEAVGRPRLGRRRRARRVASPGRRPAAGSS